MASDYKKIAEEHRELYGSGTKHLRIFKKLFGDKTHFVYELIQNADDSESSHLELQLGENRLLVWNNGRQFTEKDVRSICSLGSSDKDLTHIGTFGIGFKAVYNYTDLPEICSGDERFRIRFFTQPQGIDIAHLEVEILGKLSEGKTVFHLPFKKNLRQEEEITNLRNRLCGLEKRSLLFLRHLEKVEWRDEREKQIGSYSCHRRPHDKIQDASEVELMVSLDGSDRLEETFLVFPKEVHPPKDIIDELLRQADNEEDEEEKQRLQRSVTKPQSIEVAFKLQDGRITTMNDNCVLSAYLPTQKETHLKFLIQARYQTTPARDNVPDTSWNRWLVRETANFLPEVLKQLKEGGLLEPAFFNVIPLEEDNVPKMSEPIAEALTFELIVEALQKAMQEGPFVPTQEGKHTKAKNVFYPHRESLRQLIKIECMHPNSSWLHPEIRDAEEFSRCFKVMRKAGVKEIGIRQVLDWLEKQDFKWFENKCEEWLCSLYLYLNSQKSELERIKKLPLVRLENGKHVCANMQLVFFPPSTDETREEIEPFLNDLPILKSTSFEGEERNEIEAFLKSIGARTLDIKDMIYKWIIPQYSQPDKPPIMKNRQHVRYIFKFWQKAAERSELEESISGIPILRAYKGTQRETSDFVVPCKAYLPQAYTGDDDLETYFSVYDSDLWFVDNKYLTNKSDTKAWLQFLKAIGAMDTPNVIQKNIARKSEDYQEFGKELAKRNIKLEHTTRWWETSIKDLYLQDLPQMLDKISESNDISLARSLWQLLVKMVNPLPSELWRQNTFFNNHFQGIYRWFYRTNQQKYFNAAFYRQLKETSWFPDKQGKLHSPDKCFVPTSKNQEILGDSVTYLHPDFDVSTRPAQWLAKKLDVNLQADANGVLDYLKRLSQTETSIEKIEPIYKFLESEDADLWRFEEELLIFTPEPEPRWWRIDEVFWEDESAVFGDDRGYLKAYYSENLQYFFTSDLGVSKHADTLDYVRGIRDIASVGQTEVEVRNRVKILCGRLRQSLEEGGDWQEDEEWQEEWRQICKDACWLGKKGNEWGFFSPQKLVWKDDEYRSELFKNEVPFWGFDNDLLELAKELGVEGCYADSDIEFNYYGNQEEDTDWSRKVRGLGQNIRDFLNSPHLYGEHGEEKSAEILERLSVRRVGKLEVSFRLKGVPVPDPNPRQSFLEVTDQEATLWLALEASENQYPWLIGDALQDYFGNVKELSGFVEDLLTKDKDSVLTRWKQKGLQTNINVLSSEDDPKENEEDPGPVDAKFPGKTDSGDGVPEGEESDVGTPGVHKGPETDSGKGDSTGNAPTTHSPGGHWGGTSTTRTGTGGHSGRGGGGEGDAHRNLKNYLAGNPSKLDDSFKLVKIEYRFTSGDEADILFEDSSKNPITVEVETHIPSGNYVGVWQAVKYQHLAAVEYDLPCEEVRSILAAPEIPDDVKEECKKRGIEPIEVSD